MSAPITNASYAPTGYERVRPGHYRRRQDDPEAEAAQRAAAAVNAMSDDPFEYMNMSLGGFRKLTTEADQIKPPSALEAIAIDIRGLPYGEHMELAEAIGADPAILWKWATTYGQG
jgi:hypothetical protein